MNYHRKQRLLIDFLIAIKKNAILPTCGLLCVYLRVKVANGHLDTLIIIHEP
jgi:hypothetical protein